MHAHSQTDPHTVHRPSRTLRETTSGQCSASTGASSPSGTAASPASSGRNGRNGRNGRIVTQRYCGPCCARVGNKQLSVKLMENGSSGTAALAALGCAASIHSIVHPRSGRRRAKKLGCCYFGHDPGVPGGRWCDLRVRTRGHRCMSPALRQRRVRPGRQRQGQGACTAHCQWMCAYNNLNKCQWICLRQPNKCQQDLLKTTSVDQSRVRAVPSLCTAFSPVSSARGRCGAGRPHLPKRHTAKQERSLLLRGADMPHPATA